MIVEALGDLEYAEITKINITDSLPVAKIPITDWLIYSIINKFGTQLSAITSTPQFMTAVPLVFKNGYDTETIREDFLSSNDDTQTVKIDDLSDIDNLVEGIIDFDFVWEDGMQE